MKTGFCRVHDIKYGPALMRTSDMQFIHPHGITQVDWNCIPTPREFVGWVWQRFLWSRWFWLRYKLGR